MLLGLLALAGLVFGQAEMHGSGLPSDSGIVQGPPGHAMIVDGDMPGGPAGSASTRLFPTIVPSQPAPSHGVLSGALRGSLSGSLSGELVETSGMGGHVLACLGCAENHAPGGPAVLCVVALLLVTFLLVGPAAGGLHQTQIGVGGSVASRASWVRPFFVDLNRLCISRT